MKYSEWKKMLSLFSSSRWGVVGDTVSWVGQVFCQNFGTTRPPYP